MKRKIRRGLEIAIPLLGMSIIFLSVLFGPESLQMQVLLVLVGVLILEAGVWGLTSGLLPNERHYVALREEGDHFIELIRALNAAAVVQKEGREDDGSFGRALQKMHGSVDRMGELAGLAVHLVVAPARAGAQAGNTHRLQNLAGLERGLQRAAYERGQSELAPARGAVDDDLGAQRGQAGDPVGRGIGVR